jgi:uncharacterized lipoprotein YmbA
LIVNRKPWLLVAIAVSMALTACATSPVPTYYSLDLGAALPPASGSSPSVTISLASLPDTLDRPQMVSRSGYEVHISEQNRWAEPLRRSIPRVLASEIGSLLNSSQVAAGASLHNPDYRVLLDVQRFDVVAGSGVEIDILWRIDGKGASRAGRSTLQEPVAGNDIQPQVEAQRRGLARVAAQIAQGIREK